MNGKLLYRGKVRDLGTDEFRPTMQQRGDRQSQLGELVPRMQSQKLLKSVNGLLAVVLLQVLNFELKHLPVRWPPTVELVADFKHYLMQVQVVSARNKLTGIKCWDVSVK